MRWTGGRRPRPRGRERVRRVLGRREKPEPEDGSGWGVEGVREEGSSSGVRSVGVGKAGKAAEDGSRSSRGFDARP